MTKKRAKTTKKKDFMALTPAERSKLVAVMCIIDEALTANSGLSAAISLQKAEDELRTIQRRQWWSTHEF